MPVFPTDKSIPSVQPDIVPKSARQRAKKTTPNLAANAPVAPMPLLRAGVVENPAQTAHNRACSPPSAYPTSPILSNEEVLADTLPLALVCSDLHLSPGPPAARIEESDWPRAMKSQMLWLFEQAKKYNVPLVIAGDIFDKAIADSRFISSVIALFQQCDMPIYAVPGNHDLPYHSYTNRHESAYGILEIVSVIQNIDQTITYKIADKTVTLHGYYWNRPFSDPPPFDADYLNIAVIHKYVYDTNTGHVGADLSSRCDNQLSAMPCSYDFLVYGDNHTPFHKVSPNTTLINCGSFFRRSQSDKNLKPAAYLLKSDRSFETIYVPLEGQTFLQHNDSSPVSAHVPDFSELSEFFAEPSGMDNLTVQDSFKQFVAVSNPALPVKACLSRITGLAVG